MSSLPQHIRAFVWSAYHLLRRAVICSLLVPVKLWQWICSPLMGSHCRFHPTCSKYAEEAISTHGIRRGLYLSISRLFRCNSFFPGGLDPVPLLHPGQAPEAAEKLDTHTEIEQL